MASRAGPRASGTDGSDFTHRERVASHYKESVLWKSKLKYSIVPHLLAGLLVSVWTITSHIGYVSVKPQLWEIVWLLSIIPAILGLMSLSKNNSRLLNSYVFGTLLMGVAPLAFGASQFIGQIIQNSRNNAPMEGSGSWQVLPMKMAFVAVLIQLHIVGVFYSKKLLNAWNVKGMKKAN